ncbi:LysR family transcriptional regulator [Pseudomonas cichorii]|uniref:LysR family transcriptional regulator n=1 Tax=Pseudomonas serbiensis TaxID=3064350 RepID=A0ABT9CPP8_9PSED|nr:MULTISPECIES: LysR family transcriptional regulator [Pseudomonas]MDO7925777.1 LysR family transcriptional regulator [Pseudomonas sp. KFB-138]GFM88223.1 LysR family transcriptional regulator [Pseudomonas cichorii]
MDLRQLRHFLALANHLNFTRAAETACITQSAFSRSIQGLENELGGPLVERGSRGVVLTAKGEALRGRATRLLAEASNLRDEMAADESCPGTSRLSVGVGPLVSAHLLPQALASFVGVFPQTVMEVRVDKPSSLLTMLDEGLISFLVADLRHMDIDTRYLARPLRFRRFGLFCRAGHPLLGHPAPHFRQLVDYPRAAAMLPLELRGLLQEQWGSKGPALNLETQYNDLLPKLVASSDSIGVAQLEVIESLTASGAFQRLRCLDEPLLLRDGGACFVIVQRADQPLSNEARCMIETLLDIDDSGSSAAARPTYEVARQLAL